MYFKNTNFIQNTQTNDFYEKNFLMLVVDDHQVDYYSLLLKNFILSLFSTFR